MQYLKQLLGLTVLFFLLTSVTLAFDFSICDTPERALEELGDDYYAFCEQNVASDYYSDVPELAEEQTPVQTFYSPQEPNATRDWDGDSSFYSDELVKERVVPLGAIAGLILLLIFGGLIIWRTNHHKHITTLAISKLLPTMKQYVQVGWTNDQLTQMLLEKGYDRAFINKLLKALERKP